MKYMLITNDPEVARAAVSAGVDRIFVDLERIGKHERQGHRDTFISNHSISDISSIREQIGNTALLVRINPINKNTINEVEKVISAGADLIMLPMFIFVDEVKYLSRLVAGRVGIIPLFETPESLLLIEDIARIKGIEELYLGLNDLHMAMGLTFMFELLVNGVVEDFAARAKVSNIPFGFGGIARPNEGKLPGRLVMAEHLRLGSSSVILSRTFIYPSDLPDRVDNRRLVDDIFYLKDVEQKLSGRNSEQIDKDRDEAKRLIEESTQ